MAQGFSIISDRPKYLQPDHVDKLEQELGLRYCGEITERAFQSMEDGEHILTSSVYYSGYRFSDGSVVIPFGDSNSLFVSVEALNVTPATETELESLLGL